MTHVKRLHDIAETVEQWARKQPTIQAMYWFGSFCRGETSVASDLDCALLLESNTVWHPLSQELSDSVLDDCRFQVVLEEEGKACYWLGKHLVKLEVIMASDLKQMRWISDAEDVPPPHLSLVFSRNQESTQLLRRAQIQYQVNVSKKVEQEIEKFLLAFEACSAAHQQSDAYGMYFEYNLALGRLARLILLARGQPEHLYLPIQLSNSCLDEMEIISFRELAGTLFLPDGNKTKQKLRDFFLRTVTELGQLYNMPRTVVELEAFCNAILQRDFS